FHGGSSCNFVFWNRECELMLGLSVVQLRHTIIKARIDDPLEFPLALDQLMNLEMAFKIKESVDEAKTGAPEDCDLEITSKHKPDPTAPIEYCAIKL
ncbi:hypothetical protein RYX36_012479, partial [Vicia faba]